MNQSVVYNPLMARGRHDSVIYVVIATCSEVTWEDDEKQHPSRNKLEEQEESFGRHRCTDSDAVFTKWCAHPRRQAACGEAAQGCRIILNIHQQRYHISSSSAYGADRMTNESERERERESSPPLLPPISYMAAFHPPLCSLYLLIPPF